MRSLHMQYPQSPEEGVRTADLELTETEHPVGGRNRTQILCKGLYAISPSHALTFRDIIN